MRNGHDLEIENPQWIEPQPCLVDVEAQEQRERDEKIINYFENCLHILNAYQSHQSTAKELRMSLRAMELALGFHLAAGASGPAELARNCGVSKQALGKCLNHFMEQMNLSPLPCQRKAQARDNMRLARKEQVNGTHLPGRSPATSAVLR